MQTPDQKELIPIPADAKLSSEENFSDGVCPENEKIGDLSKPEQKNAVDWTNAEKTYYFDIIEEVKFAVGTIESSRFGYERRKMDLVERKLIVLDKDNKIIYRGEMDNPSEFTEINIPKNSLKINEEFTYCVYFKDKENFPYKPFSGKFLMASKPKELNDAFFSADLEECVPVIKNGSSSQKLDIVFVGLNKNKIDDDHLKQTAVYSAISGSPSFKSTPPFSDNFNKLNFWVTKKNSKLSAKLKCSQGDMFVFLDASFNGPGLGFSFFGSREITLYYEGYGNHSGSIIHETGHALCDLMDEYVYSGYGSGWLKAYATLFKRENCFTSKEKCVEIRDSEDQCALGCSLSDWYKLTDDSIMDGMFKIDKIWLNACERQLKKYS